MKEKEAKEQGNKEAEKKDGLTEEEMNYPAAELRGIKT